MNLSYEVIAVIKVKLTVYLFFLTKPEREEKHHETHVKKRINHIHHPDCSDRCMMILAPWQQKPLMFTFHVNIKINYDLSI
jgi:hypothetical protein